GSTDGTREVAEAFKDRLPRLLVVDASARRGASYARNVGALSASGEAFLFLDADDEIAPGYLPAMADALAHHDFVAAYRDSESLNTGWAEGLAEANTAPPSHPWQVGLGALDTEARSTRGTAGGESALPCHPPLSLNNEP